MAYDESINGRVFDPSTGHELIVEGGRVVANVLPGNEYVVDSATGAAVELAPGQSYVITKQGHPVILNEGQEWVDVPATEQMPQGGFVRTTPTAPTAPSTPATPAAPTPPATDVPTAEAPASTPEAPANA